MNEPETTSGEAVKQSPEPQAPVFADVIAAAAKALNAGTPEAPVETPVLNEGTLEDVRHALDVMKEAQKAPEVPTEPVAEALAPNIAAIMRRDRRQKELHEQRVAELAKREQELAAKMQQVASIEELTRMAVERPVEFFEKYGNGAKLADIGAQLVYKEMGNDVPEDVKEKYKVRRLETQIADLARKNEEMIKHFGEQQKLAEQSAMLRSYERSVADYTSEVPETLQHVRAIVDHDKAGAVNALMRLAVAYAQQYPDGEPLKPAQLAEYLEQGLQAEVEPFAGRIYEKKQFEPKAKVVASAEPKSAPVPALTSAKLAASTPTKSPAMTEEERLKRAIAAFAGA